MQIDQILRNVTTVMSIALGRVDKGFGGDGAASTHVGRSGRIGSGEKGQSGGNRGEDGGDEEESKGAEHCFCLGWWRGEGFGFTRGAAAAEMAWIGMNRCGTKRIHRHYICKNFARWLGPFGLEA